MKTVKMTDAACFWAEAILAAQPYFDVRKLRLSFVCSFCVALCIFHFSFCFVSPDGTGTSDSINFYGYGQIAYGRTNAGEAAFGAPPYYYGNSLFPQYLSWYWYNPTMAYPVNAYSLVAGAQQSGMMPWRWDLQASNTAGNYSSRVWTTIDSRVGIIGLEQEPQWYRTDEMAV